jgi:hypothetical protein
LSDDEKHRQIVQVWSDVKSQIEAIVKKMLIAAGDDVFAMIDS